MAEKLLDRPPDIFGSNEAYFGFPDDDYFRKLAEPLIRYSYSVLDYPTLEDIPEEEQWFVKNTIFGQKDDYFRKRYRDSEFRYSPDGPAGTYESYLSESFFSPAMYAAVRDYTNSTEGSEEQELHRQRIVFAGSLHINDTIRRSWAFLDPSLKDDGLVRNKHFIGFLYRANKVSGYVKTHEEKSEFELQKHGLQLAVAELGAQNPLALCSDLSIMDSCVANTGENAFFNTARSKLMALNYMLHELKLKVIKRYQDAARLGITYGGDRESDAFFLMQLLHLFGLSTASTHYDPETHEMINAWFREPAENVLSGITTMPVSRPSEPNNPESYGQESLF